MPEIIEARVIQKVATEAEWNAITLTLYKGEIALVTDGDGKPINMKVGVGNKVFSELPYFIDYSQAAYIEIDSFTLPTPTVEVGYGFGGEGTYTFGATTLTVASGHWGMFSWGGGVWSVSDMGALPTADVSDKTDKGGYNGTSQDLEDQIIDLEKSLEESNPVVFTSTLPGVRFTSDTVTSSIDTTQTVVDENTLRVSRVSTGATASCIYLNTSLVLNQDNKLVSFRYKINSENIANSGVMLGYGSISNIPTVVPRGIVWRSGGQLFYITPYSSSGTFPTQQSYIVNDIVGIDYEVIYDETETNIVAGRFRLYKNGVYTDWFDDAGTYSGTVMIGFRGGLSYDASGELQNSKNILNQAKEYTDVQILKKSSNVTFYVDGSVGTSGIGTFNSPFKTFSDAIGSIESIPNGTVIAREGAYRESLNVESKTDLNLKLLNYNNERVDLLCSNAITGWSKTVGRTNIYEVAFSGTIPAQVRDERRLFENGRYSMPIPTGERHALQKGLEFALPYTEIGEFTFSGSLGDALTELDTLENRFYINSGVLYIHITGGANPSTTGYSIENQSRSALIPPLVKRNVNIEMSFINSFFSSNYGFDFLNFNSVVRKHVSSFGSRNNGFADDIGTTIAYWDEAGGSGNDGASGHFNRRPAGFASLNDRSGMNQNLYVDPWYHRNRDDGMSHHTYGDGTTIGGLFEYNGKAGIIPANGCNWRQYGGLARNNAVAGIYIGNAISNRNFASFNVQDFVSEGNAANYRVSDDANWVLNLFNCYSRNATAVGYRCSLGTINATSCYTEGDVLAKLAENGGTINIMNSGSLLS